MSNFAQSVAQRGRGVVATSVALCGILLLPACGTQKSAPSSDVPAVVSSTPAAATLPVAPPMPAKPENLLPAKPENLRLVLRSTAEITAAKQSSAAIVAQPLVGDLWQALTIRSDSGESATSFRLATSSDLDQLRLTPSDAFALGQQNALAGLAPLASVTHDLTPHQIGVIQSAGDETSRALSAKDWAPLARQLDGHLLIAVPANDTVLYCEENGSQSVRTFAAAARDTAAKAQHAVSPALLRWTPAGWQSVAVP